MGGWIVPPEALYRVALCKYLVAQFYRIVIPRKCNHTVPKLLDHFDNVLGFEVWPCQKESWELDGNWYRSYPAICVSRFISLHSTSHSSQMSSIRIERAFAQTPGTEDFPTPERLLVLVDIKVRGGTGSPYAEGFAMIFCT